MEFVVQQLISGLAMGGTYALVALGFVLIFGVLNILNIAHIQTIMLAPISFALIVGQGVPIAVAVVLSLAITVLFGAAVFLIGLKPFVRPGRKSTYLAPFIASFGISLFVEHLVGAQLGSDPRSFPMPTQIDLWQIGKVFIVPINVINLAIVAILLVAFALIINRTDFGRAMRAVAENAEVAAAQGISVDRTILITVIGASVLGGISGLLFAADSRIVSPFMGLDYGLKGLVVMIVGGVASPVGAVIAGLLLGVLEAVTVAYVSSVYRDVITFGLLFAVLIIRPQGLFVVASREARL
ncbi:MAG: branched-chain amino acid ABC transporter permease [Burkholderiales bacterium]